MYVFMLEIRMLLSLHFLTVKDPRGTKITTNLYLSLSQLQGSYHISKRYTLGATAGLRLLSKMLGKIQGKEEIVAASPKLWGLVSFIANVNDKSEYKTFQKGHMARRDSPLNTHASTRASVTCQWVSDHKVCPGASFLGDPQVLLSQQQPQSWGWRDGLELTALVALLEVLGTIPTTNTVARKHL